MLDWKSLVKRRGDRYVACLVIVLLVSAAGCGDSGVDVNGQILIDGEPPQLADGRVLRVSLVTRQPSADAPSSTSRLLNRSAETDAQGRFLIKNLPTGQYLASVADFEHFPFGDRLAQHFRDHPDALPLSIDGDEPVILDIESTWYVSTKRRSKR